MLFRSEHATVGAHGGVFHTFDGVQAQFGERRAVDTPISEQAIIGLGVGAALTGLRPIVDLMFMDFICVALDQIVNQAAKLKYMFGGTATIPLTITTTGGAGLSAAAQHSQSLEALLVHIPGLKVVCPSTPEDAKGLIIAAIEDPNPVLFFEHKHLYRRIKGEVPDERYLTPLGEARIHQAGEDITVITWGAMVHTATEAAAELPDLSVEIIDLRTILPWDKEAVLASVRKTSKALVLHEDTRTGGFGGEIAATIAEEAFEHLDAPVRRVAAPDTPVPFAPVLEKAFIPQVADVAAALRSLSEY
mgnify:CR=1 FL=1